MSAVQKTLPVPSPEEAAANEHLLAVTLRAFPGLKKMAAPDAARLLVDVEDILAGKPTPNVSRAARECVELAAKELAAPKAAPAPAPEPDAPGVLLVDLSSIVHPIWHMSQSEPDPNHTSIQVVAKVRALAAGQKHVAVCCDSGKSFRAEIDPTYKANRPESDATLQHQITLARETLLGDGFPVWAVKGFEADDLIATATRVALEAGFNVLIASSDKDLLQLVNGRVKAKSLRDGAVIDADAVRAKFGVSPEQMRDYLSLVGDASDNVKGAKNIGPVNARNLLELFGSLDNLYAQVHKLGYQDLGIKPSQALNLDEFEARYPTVRSLIALRDDVEIPFSEILKERVPKEAAAFAAEFGEDLEEPVEQATLPLPAVADSPAPPSTPTPAPDTPAPPTASAAPAPAPAATAQPPDPPVSTATAAAPAQAAPAVRVLEQEPPSLLERVIEATPPDWNRGLDPRSPKEARTVALDLFNSRMFSDYGTPQAVLSTIMVGRELGLPAMASLRGIHNIKGQHALSAALMAGLVIKSGLADFFRPVTDDAGNIDADEKHATFETLRKGPDNRLTRFTYTIEEATTAGLVKKDSGWEKNPKSMLIARAEAGLARLIYPELMAGLYTPEELEEVRNAA